MGKQIFLVSKNEHGEVTGETLLRMERQRLFERKIFEYTLNRKGISTAGHSLDELRDMFRELPRPPKGYAEQAREELRQIRQKYDETITGEKTGEQQDSK